MTKARSAMPYLILIGKIMLIGWLPSEAHAQAVAFDAATSAGTGTTASLTFSHTTSGANRLLIVGVSLVPSGGATVTSVTYAGTNLTLVGTAAFGSEARMYLWRLVAPATGANNVVVTMSSAAIVVAGAASFTNAHQTTPLGSFFSSTGNNASPSLTVTGVNVDEMVVDVLGMRQNSTATASAGQIRRWNRASTVNQIVGAGSTEPYSGSGTVTMSWTVTEGHEFALGAVSIKPAPAAVTPLTVVKSSQSYSDPFNGTVNSKEIPGALVAYQVVASNPGLIAVDANTVFVFDAVPASTDLFVGNLGGPGSGPVAFSALTSGLTYTFTSLASTTDDVSFSTDGGTTYTYTPMPDANGVDPAVTHIRINPKGTFSAASSCQLQFRVRVK